MNVSPSGHDPNVYTIYVNDLGQHTSVCEELKGDNYKMEATKSDVSGTQYMTWSTNDSKILIDLYKKYKGKVGSFQIKTIKKLWEVIATEFNRLLMTNVSPQNCENRWRVLERGYKRFVDNKNKTGRGRKFFEFETDMEEIFKKKRNIYPEIILSAESVNHNKSTLNEVKTGLAMTEEALQKPQVSSEIMKTPRSKKVILNRNEILENIRRSRDSYQQERLQIEKDKLEVRKQILAELKRRNDAIEERNRLFAKS